MAVNETPTLLRMCDSCGGVDGDPRHSWWLTPGEQLTDDSVAAKALENAAKQGATLEILAQVRDDTLITKHFDCCREDGCPDGTCDRMTAGAEDLKGDALREHLVNLGPQEA